MNVFSIYHVTAYVVSELLGNSNEGGEGKRKVLKLDSWTYHGLVEVQFVGCRLVGRSHGGRPVHAVVYLIERVETRSGMCIGDGLAQQLADLDGICRCKRKERECVR